MYSAPNSYKRVEAFIVDMSWNVTTSEVILVMAELRTSKPRGLSWHRESTRVTIMDRILTQTRRNAKLTLKVTSKSYMAMWSNMTYAVLL